MSRRYNELMQKDIQENMNSLYDGPFQRDTRPLRGQIGQGGGGAHQGGFIEHCNMYFGTPIA